MSASALSDRDFAQVRAVQKASAFALSKSSEAGRTLNVCIGRFVSGFATAHAQGRRSNSVPDWATLASFVLAAFLPATPDLARSRRNFNFKRQFDTIRGLEKIVAGAAGQLFENAQDKSMSELCVPDPFGQARRS